MYLTSGEPPALVGSHEEVADRIVAYRRLGIDEFTLSGPPHLQAAHGVGEGVVPAPRRRGRLGDDAAARMPEARLTADRLQVRELGGW